MLEIAQWIKYHLLNLFVLPDIVVVKSIDFNIPLSNI